MAICQTSPNQAYRYYGTQAYNNRLLSTDTSFAANQHRLHNNYLDFLYFGEMVPQTLYLIFHVLQSGNMPEISDQDILLQVEQLNRDFNSISDRIVELEETVFVGYEYNPQISFCLPEVQIKGGDKLPIIRKQGLMDEWGNTDSIKFDLTGGSDAFYPGRFINIWITGLTDTLTGFAQWPGGPLNTDGIVIDYRYLTLDTTMFHPFNEGKSLTHLMGSYLGLHDLWHDVNRCFDDYVYDTPIHNDPNIGFEIIYPHFSTCLGWPIEMTMNFMDNVVDSVPFIFTRGQAQRMQSVLDSHGLRRNLVTGKSKCIDLMPVSTPLISNASYISIFPNPATDKIYLSTPADYSTPGTINCFDTTGKLMFSISDNNNASSFAQGIDISNLHAGLYYLCIVNANSSTVRSFIAVQHD